MQKDKNARADLNAVGVTGVILIGYLIWDAIYRTNRLFSVPGAVTAPTPIDGQSVIADIGSGVPAVANTLLVTVADVNPISTGSFVIAIIVPALAYIAAAVVALVLLLRMFRGRTFEALNTKLTTAVSLLVLGGCLTSVFFENMGLNGLFAAADDQFDGQNALMWGAAPYFLAAMAIGFIPIVFTRGIQLQKDTEGLV